MNIYTTQKTKTFKETEENKVERFDNGLYVSWGTKPKIANHVKSLKVDIHLNSDDKKRLCDC